MNAKGATPLDPPGRPPVGAGHYLRDMVYGASDGVVTTLAVVAGVAGAALPNRVALILGLANLIGDGFSMGASNYLALKSELEQTGGSVAKEMPHRHGLATFGAFLVVGAIPLFALLIPSGSRLAWASVLSVLALGGAGAARARFIRRTPLACAAEMIGIGTVAGGAAFVVGFIGRLLGAH